MSSPKVIAERGFGVTFVEIETKYYPDICFNLTLSENSRLPRVGFDVIKTSFLRLTLVVLGTVGASALVTRDLEINRSFLPSRWWIETLRLDY